MEKPEAAELLGTRISHGPHRPWRRKMKRDVRAGELEARAKAARENSGPEKK